jgi:hypothetical protein
MRNLIIAAAIAVSGFVAGSAEAMPLGPVKALQSTTAGDVVKIDYPCGRGWHENRRGRCVPNDRWDRRPPPPRWHRPPSRWDDGPPRHGHHRPPPPWRY